VQELLLAVHNQRHTYDPRQPITAWVYAIARYKLVDLLRRRSRKESLNDPLDEEDDLLATSTARQPRRAAIWPSCWPIFQSGSVRRSFT